MGLGAAIIGGIGGIAKTILGASQASKARKAINKYERQELTNVYGGLSVSSLGADLQREELARATATGVSALQQSGVRGLVGGLGRLQAGNIQQSRQIGSDLDLQQKEIDRLRARDEARIRHMQERREEEDLRGLGQQQMVGQQNLFSGIGDIASIAGSAGSVGGIMGGGGRKPVSSVSQISSFGMQGMGFSNPFLTG